MFTVHLPTRRQVLAVGAFGTIGLADWLRAAGPPRPRPKAAILIYLSGGPSHLDTYDLKPNAPLEVRGDFRPIKTAVPGVAICEHLPLQAKMFDKLAVIRSVVPVADEHVDAGVMTGYPSAAAKANGHPSFGSVVWKVRGMAGGMPGFVSLRGLSPGCEPGMLGGAYRAFSPSGQAAADLRLPRSVNAARRAEQADLLSAFDTMRRDLDAGGAMAAMDAHQRQAAEMLASGRVRQALAITREPSEVLERYSGVEAFLKARRLVEAGVGCVTLGVGSWDTHSKNFASLKEQLPWVDRGVSALVTDLHDRGLDKDVAVVMWGEFGRTPRVNKDAGRDHWAPVMSALVAGGGMKMGQAIGATTARGEGPKEKAYKVQQVLATLYRAVGLDPARAFANAGGRPVPVLEQREGVRELG